jgi:hypothetical protein
MKQIISALFLCMLLSAVPELQAQNIQLHYDFGRSLYDKDLQGRPLLTSTVESFICYLEVLIFVIWIIPPKVSLLLIGNSP